MRKRLKKSDWRFWALLVLGLGTCVVMAWKLMPLSVGEFTFVILMTILGTAGYCWLQVREEEEMNCRQAGSGWETFLVVGAILIVGIIVAAVLVAVYGPEILGPTM